MKILHCPRCSRRIGDILPSGELAIAADATAKTDYDVVIVVCPSCFYAYRWALNKLPMSREDAEKVIICLMDSEPLPAPLKRLMTSAQKIVSYKKVYLDRP